MYVGRFGILNNAKLKPGVNLFALAPQRTDPHPRYGLVSICTAGAMAGAFLLER